ncbi:MAG: ScyD/ScyE family protein [Lewinellaceae bacterium]|nr:ScyD/ScyE family protein [Lewinellaceae bacterium]
MKQLITLATAIFVATSALTAQVMPTIVGQGFTKSLIGIEVDGNGKIWLTEQGSGNNDGAITVLNPDGTTSPFMAGLASALTPSGELSGPVRTIQLAGDKVLVVMGEGVQSSMEALLIVDKSGWTPSAPLPFTAVEQTIKIGDFTHAQGAMNSNPYNLTWDAAGDMYIADAGGNSIVKRKAATGELSQFASFPPFPNPLPFGPPVVDPVPTDIVTKPDGSGFYVCQLTGFPFVDSVANVYNLDNSGNYSVWQSGFTLLTDMGFDPADGNLCVLQLSRFGPVDTTFGFYPGAGSVIKIWPDGSREVIAESFIGLCPSFCFDAVGDLYVSDLFGFVYKYDLVTGTEEANLNTIKVTASPNPFSERVDIGFELESPASVRANIYDLNGRLIKAFSGQKMAAGKQVLTWEASAALPGTYIYHLLVEGRLASGMLEVSR